MDCCYCHQSKCAKEEAVFFDQYKNLNKLLLSLPLAEHTQVRLIGGEVSLFPGKIREIIKSIRKVETKRDVQFFFTIATNGSNMAELIKLSDEKYVKPSGITFSWDGIYSCSRSRKPKNPMFTDEYFKEQIKLVGNSKHNRDIHFAFAITPQTISSMYDSLMFLLENNCFHFTFYFIYEGEYLDPEFIKEYEKQVRLVGQEFIKRYPDPFRRFQYHNWNVLYHRSHYENDGNNAAKFAKCKNLGKMFHVVPNGEIYPCVVFGDHGVSKIGDLEHGFHRNAVETFVDSCLKQPACNYEKCGNLNCHECPASTLLNKGGIENRFMNVCHLRNIENRIFNELFDPSTVTPYDKEHFWCMWENERDEHIYEPGYSIPVSDYDLHHPISIGSPTKDYVAGEWYK